MSYLPAARGVGDDATDSITLQSVCEEMGGQWDSASSTCSSSFVPPQYQGPSTPAVAASTAVVVPPGAPAPPPATSLLSGLTSPLALAAIGVVGLVIYKSMTKRKGRR